MRPEQSSCSLLALPQVTYAQYNSISSLKTFLIYKIRGRKKFLAVDLPNYAVDGANFALIITDFTIYNVSLQFLYKSVFFCYHFVGL